MDTSNLKENGHLLLSHLESEGYTTNYIFKMKNEISTILSLADSKTIASYADAYNRYRHSGLNKIGVRGKWTLISAIEKFDLHGQYPDGSVKQTFVQRGAYYELSPEYKEIVDCFGEYANKERKSESTVRRQSCNASVFLLSLQRQGVTHLSDVTQENILSIFIAPDGSIKNGSTTRQTATFLKTCAPKYPECKKVLLLLPIFRYKRKNIQHLTPDEIGKIKKALKLSHLTFRDKAIGTIALHTGLRGSDIAGLKKTSIDWNKDEITVHQRKTKRPLTIPLTAIVGNAILDYLEYERPETDCEYLFVSYKRPFGRLTYGAMYDVSSLIMKAANIRQDMGERQGLHIFRHHFATALLGNGISRPIVSALTGHADPESLDTYLSADFPSLKECAISIEKFPTGKEVFSL